MKAFIFQSVPDRFNLREELQEGHKVTWYATRYQSLMQPGDLVFFWMGGERGSRGLYGWGRLASAAYIKPAWDSHGVDVICDCKFAAPLLATQIRALRILRDMLILRAPQGTNFLLSDTELHALISAITEQGYPTPQVQQ